MMTHIKKLQIIYIQLYCNVDNRYIEAGEATNIVTYSTIIHREG